MNVKANTMQILRKWAVFAPNVPIFYTGIKTASTNLKLPDVANATGMGIELSL